MGHADLLGHAEGSRVLAPHQHRPWWHLRLLRGRPSLLMSLGRSEGNGAAEHLAGKEEETMRRARWGMAMMTLEANRTIFRIFFGVVATLVLLLGIPSCSSSESAATSCTPGQQSSCACPGGTTGIQTCNQDGKGLGPCLNCGGSGGNPEGGGSPEGGTEPPTATYCVEHCDDSRCNAVVTCIGESPSGWTGPVALALTPGTLPPCDATFATKLFEGGDQPKADPTTCSTLTCGPPNAPPAPQVCMSGGTTPTTIPPASWTNKALGCRANPPSNGNCGTGKVCSGRPSSVFRQSLCIANLTGDVPCPDGPYTERHVLGQSFNDTRSCDPPTCGSPPVCTSVPNPPKGSVSAASLVTVCCTS